MPIPENWQPTYDEGRTRRLLNQYKGRAHLLPEDQQEDLQRHAEAYGIPFYTGDFSLLDAVKQAGYGFFQGFTTLKVGEAPDNEFTSVARSIGHLAGFAPGIMAGPLAAAGTVAKSRMLMNAARKVAAVGEYSVPMLAAGFATKQAKKLAGPAFKAASVAQAGAAQGAAKMLSTGAIAHVAEGAFHLGVASGVSHWQEGIDAMMGAAVSGAAYGGIFRGIGNLVKTDSEAATKAIKTLAGSMVMGLPETMRGATTPEQVYSYLLGAYFGGKELPWTKQKASKYIRKMEERGAEDLEFTVKFDPELMPEWAETPPEVQKVIREQIDTQKGTTAEQRGMQYALAEELGILDKIPLTEEAPEGFKSTGKIVKGEEQLVVDEKAHPTLHHGISGAAEGADKDFASIGKDFGVPFVHYVFKKQTVSRGMVGTKRKLSERELSEANEAVNAAQQALDRDIGKQSPYALNLFRRTYHAVKYANGVYAVAPLEAGAKSVAGGTAWGVQMGINARKPVFVYSEPHGQWFEYNHKAGHFVPFDGVPKLTSRFAGIGSRKIGPAGKEAIRELYAENMDKPVEDKPVAPDAPKGMVRLYRGVGGTSKESYVKDGMYVGSGDDVTGYGNRLSTTTDINVAKRFGAVILEFDVPESYVKEYGIKKAVYKPDGKTIQGEEIAFKEGLPEKFLAKPAQVDPKIETAETVEAAKPKKPGTQMEMFEDIEGASEMENEGLDIGNKIRRQIGSISVRFVNQHMKDAWEGAEPEMRPGIKADLAETLQNSIKNYLDIGGKNNRAEEWADSIQEETGYILEPQARREMRRWMTLKNTGKPVRFFSALDKGKGGIDIGLMPAHSPYTKSGQPKNLLEPAKAIEEAYIEAGGEVDPNKPLLIIMDHVTIKDNNGNKDMPLSRYRTFYLPKQEKGQPVVKKVKAQKQWNRSLSRIFGFNSRDNDMYAFGGAGDKDRLYFIKYHPKAEPLDITSLKETLGSKFEKEYDLAETAFVNAYGMIKPSGGTMSRKEAREMYRRAYASNLRYDLDMNGLELNRANVKKLAGDGFIHGATAYNKRLQIYMTSGFKHNDTYASENITDLTNGRYKFQIKEEKPDDDVTVDTPNTKMAESTDGGIVVRDDVVDTINADFGNIEAGENKSFIISKDSKHGAFLGKYMFHAAGPKQSADMAKDNLHFKVYNSAAKQKGTRLYNTDYFMNPSDIRGGGSTAATEHMLKRQVWVKQLFTSLGPASHAPASKDVVNDIYDSVIKNRFDGEDKWNNELSKYLTKPTPKRMGDLIKNIDRIGVEPLLEAITRMNGPDANRFSELAYSEIVKQNMELIDDMVREGELELWEAQEAKTELYEFNSATDNMLKRGRRAIEDARNKGKDVTGLGIFLHKHVRDWRMATMRNWIVNQVTRPKMDNSMLSFMRPYDSYLARDADKVNPRLKELDTNDEIFFLNDAYKKMDIKTSIKGMKKTTLGKLWEAYDKGELKGENVGKAEDLFEAVAVRVPMDSVSGAQVLKFQGFTGRKGYGVLLHGRAMKAMGGADLDGDEAFVYFGDEAHGMKKAWKDVFKANRGEYIDESGKRITPGKTAKITVGADKGKTYKDILTMPFSKKEADLQNSKAWQWSPFQRVEISQRAVEGRNQLATTASSVQVMRAAYSALIGTPRRGKIPPQTDSFTITRGYGKKKQVYRITYNAKTDLEWQKHQRALTRAEVAFASDPLDELGLRGDDVFLKKLWTAYFNMADVKILKGRKYVPTKDIKSVFDLQPWEVRNGMLGDFFDMNSAYFGRNWKSGRRWNLSELKEKGKNVYNYSSDQVNTMLPKMVQTLQPVDWSDSIFSRVDPVTLKMMYNDANDIVGRPESEGLRTMMDRSTLKTTYNKQISTVVNNQLWSYNSRENIARSVPEWKKIVKEIPEYNEEYRNAKTYQERFDTLTKISRNAEDYIVNDLTDIITIRRISDIMEVMTEEEKAGLPNIHKMVERLKSQSYLMARNRGRKGTFAEPITEKDRLAQELADMLVESDLKITNEDWYRRMRGLDQGDDVSAEMDQAQIDGAIRLIKNDLTPKQKVAFDFMMLGSLNRGPLKAIDKLKDKLTKEGRWNPLTRDLVHSMNMEAARTSLSRLGYSSKAVHPSSVERFMLDFATLTGESWKPPASAEIKAEQDAVKQLDIHKIDAVGKQVELDIGEPEIDPKIEGSLIEDMSHFEGLRKGTLTKEQAKIITELAGHLKSYNNKVGQHINEITRGVLRKDLNAMNADDFRALNNYFSELKGGTIWQRIWQSKGPPDMQRRYTWMFPETMDRELMRDEIILLKRKGVFATKDGEIKYGDVYEPSHYQTVMMNWVNRSNDFATQKSEEQIHKSTVDLLFVDSINEGEALREIAIRQRELPIADYIMSQEEVPEMLRRAESQIYKNEYKDVTKRHNYEELKDKKFTVNIKDKRVTMTGQEVVSKINEVYTELFGNLYEKISGKDGALDPYIIGYYDKKTQLNPIIDSNKFINEMMKNYREGKPIEMDVGVDGLRKIAKSMMIEMIPTTEAGLKVRKNLEKLIIDETRRIPFENYWPHMIFDKKVAEKSLLDAIEYVRNSNLTKEEQDAQLARLAYKHKQITGEWGSDALLEWQAWEETLDNIGHKQAETSDILKWYSANQKMGSMFSRDSHIPGWAADATITDAYIRNLMGTYYKQFSQIMGRNIINKFEVSAKKKGWDKIKEPGDEFSLMQRWSNWYKLYMQDAIGNPTVIPDRMLNDPKMKISGTPYAWWADNKVREKVNKIGDFLGIANKDLPENLQGVTLQQLRHWSNLEAKYEFATLLTHPKTIMANIFGGSMHTIQSAGFQNFRDARNPKWLKQNLPEVKIGEETIRWDSIEDVKRFIDHHGVLPEFLAYEAEISPEIRGAKNKDFIREASRLIVERPDATISDLRELNRKHRVTETAFKKLADIFMGKPERILRRDSFMAHYVHYWKKFGGAIKDPNHPFLIELAKKGVKATQFLYNAPNRPPFARSALGKVMTRFQLWAWNAARFRNDVNRQMNVYGYRPGSAAYEKYKRQMGLDLFMLTLANVFMYSMFDNQLPAPWNWLQDTADWVLGDEKERDKAFFGAYPTSLAPLQLVTPPIARLGPAAIRGWLDDDWSKLADYQVWTMFPMGRMAKSVFGPNNLIENPIRVMEQTTGFPLGQLHRYMKEGISVEEQAPGFRGFL